VRVLFYVTGHGYGHATRNAAVMNALVARRPDVELYARTEAPEWVFRNSVSAPVRYQTVRVDGGMIEKDLLAQDPAATLARAQQVFADAERIVRDEAEFVRRNEIQVIVSDIPPLASVIGRAAGVPVVAMGNFSWDYIYAPFAERLPAFAPIIEAIRECYASTDLLLRLPWSPEMEVFPRREPIPLVAREPQGSRDETRRQLYESGAPADRPLVLLGGRFPSLSPETLAQVLRDKRWTLLSYSDFGAGPLPGLLVLDPEWQPRFLDVLQACDVVVSKLGYGIASECVSCRARVLYPPREEFAEHPFIETGLASWVPTQRIERAPFERGAWREPIEALLERPFDWPDVPLNGAQVAAGASWISRLEPAVSSANDDRRDAQSLPILPIWQVAPTSGSYPGKTARLAVRSRAAERPLTCDYALRLQDGLSLQRPPLPIHIHEFTRLKAGLVLQAAAAGYVKAEVGPRLLEAPGQFQRVEHAEGAQPTVGVFRIPVVIDTGDHGRRHLR